MTYKLPNHLIEKCTNLITSNNVTDMHTTMTTDATTTTTITPFIVTTTTTTNSSKNMTIKQNGT